MKKSIAAALLYSVTALPFFGMALPAAALADIVTPGNGDVGEIQISCDVNIYVNGGPGGVVAGVGAYWVDEEPENTDPKDSNPTELALFCYGGVQCANQMNSCDAARQAAIDFGNNEAEKMKCPTPINVSTPCPIPIPLPNILQ